MTHRVIRTETIKHRFGDITVEIWSDGEVYIGRENEGIMIDHDTAEKLKEILQWRPA